MKLKPALLGLFGLVLVAAPCAAQVSSLGMTNSGPAQNGHFSVVAHDDKHDVYLHVWDDNSTILGRFVGTDGVPRGASFTIAPLLNIPGASVAVAYSRGAADDEFLVLYSDVSGRATARLLRFSGTGANAALFVGSPFAVSAPSVVDYYLAFDAIFNPRTRQFLVAWGNNYGGTTPHTFVSRVTTTGTLDGAAKEIGNTLGASAKVAFDWQRNQYLVGLETVIRDYCPNVRGVAAVPLDAEATPIAAAVAEFNTTGLSADYLPAADGFVYSSTRMSGFGTACIIQPESVRGRVISGATGLPEAAYAIVSDKGYRSTLAYDAVCNCVLAVLDANNIIDGRMLDSQGQPASSVFRLSASTLANSTRPMVRAADGQFVVSYLTDAGAILERFSVPNASVPGPRFSNVMTYVDEPVNGATVRGAFTFRGWTVDFGAGASDGTGIDGVHVWAFPAGGGSPVFVGENQSRPRPDVSAVFGAHFADAGFELSTSALSPGTYTIVSYPHSAISGAFTRGDAVTVTVASPLYMNLDGPTPSSIVALPFSVAGWAIDLGAGASGAGIDTIHVWAFPVSGAAAIFVGVPEYARPRPDVASVFGAQFLNSGFQFEVSTLPPGRYQLVAYAHSTVTGTFSQQRGVDITVRDPANPAMAIDSPSNGSAPNLPFAVTGWAVDLGASTGTGVDAIHVWAFPVSGGPAVFLGAASYGAARPDVGTVFGARFTASAFTLTVSGLTAGQTYDIGVYPHSSVSGTFNQQRIVRVTVQ